MIESACIPTIRLNSYPRTIMCPCYMLPLRAFTRLLKFRFARGMICLLVSCVCFSILQFDLWNMSKKAMFSICWIKVAILHMLPGSTRWAPEVWPHQQSEWRLHASSSCLAESGFAPWLSKSSLRQTKATFSLWWSAKQRLRRYKCVRVAFSDTPDPSIITRVFQSVSAVSAMELMVRCWDD